MMFVVVAPLFVICWRVAVVAADPGQFVPFARQTFDPFTWMLEAKRLVPLAVPKEKIVEVDWEAVRVVKEPEPAVNVVMLPVFAVRSPRVAVPIEPLFAKSWVVEATPEAYRLVVEAEPKMAEVAKRFVEVVFVPVALVQVRFETASAPERVRFANEPFVAERFVVKRFVVVAEVPVAFTKVKF
jgi:hypothetical protein